MLLIRFAIVTMMSFLSTSAIASGGSPSSLSSVHDADCPVTDISSLIVDVFGIISKHSTNEDMGHLSLSNRALNKACQQAMAHRAKLFLVGDVPAFIPAMKKCMINDHVGCYRIVLKHFALRNKQEPWRLNQLPALAAQLGAHKIFRLLGVDESHPLWNSWMTRAAIRERNIFLANLSSTIAYKKKARQVALQDFYIPELDSRHATFQTHLQRVEHYRRDGFQLHSEVAIYLQDDQYSAWMNASMADPDSYPTVHQIFKTLKIEDVTERRKQIQELKAEIQNVLSQGVYLVDDMLEVTENMALLWLNFGNTSSNRTLNNASSSRNNSISTDDGGRSDFLQWLIDEGAPLDDKKWIDDQIHQSSINRSKFEQWISLNVRYVSGSGTAALSSTLKRRYKQAEHWYPSIRPKSQNQLHFFKYVLGADLFDSDVMKDMIRYWSWIDDNGEMDYYIANGLQLDHVLLLDAYVRSSIPESDRSKPNMIRALETLKRSLKASRIKKKLPIIPDLLTWWVALLI